MRAAARRSAAAAAAVAIALSVGGCSILLPHRAPTEHGPSQSPTSQSQSGALDQLVQQAQGQIALVKAQSAGTYSDVRIEAIEPGTIAYTYVYSKHLDVATAAAYFDAQAGTLQQSCDTQVFPAMTAAGITSGQHAKYTYLNPDGSLIWSRTFSPSD